MGVFDRIFASLAGKGGKPDRLIIDATHLKAHRTTASLLKKGFRGKMIHWIISLPLNPRRIGRTKGGLNSKLHAVTDGDGKPLIMLLTEGQMSDHKGARIMLPKLPKAKSLTGDRGGACPRA